MTPDWLRDDEAICHVHRRAAVEGVRANWPDWLGVEQQEWIEAQGIPAPWRHQREVAELAHAGRHVAISTPTASGKTLGYLMPIIADTGKPLTATLHATTNARELLATMRPTALYLAPTKALAHDQYRAARELGPEGWAVATLDGDSDQAERRYARDLGAYILTNPDMLHRAVLPNHARWASFLRGLRYVVIDEAHRYRGVFGAQVAGVIRRLRRLAEQYGASPTFILASATAVDAGDFGARLIGEPEPIAVVNDDASPHGAREVVLWRPKDSAPHDAADLMAGLVNDGRQVITFVPSRTQAELIAMRAQDRVVSERQIVSYRSGYLATDRRELEAGLQKGWISGVAATNALELGVDISGMDAVIIVGVPGTLASLWQQAGRAGRGDRDALVIVVAADDPRDTYLFDHPELIFDAPVEHTIVHPENPYVLGPHLAAAAQEAALTLDDTRWFGDGMVALADQLCAAGLLRRRARGWFWVRPERAVDAIDLRSAGGRPIQIIDIESGRVVGHVDQGAADRTVHPGAVYLHQGEQWLVEQYAPDEHQALVRQGRPGYYTQPKGTSDARILSVIDERPFGRGMVSTGEVDLTGQVIAFLRRDEITSEVWDETPLTLPEHTLRTRAVWFTIPASVVATSGLSMMRLAAAAHAAEHTAIGLLPMFAPCDRWDIGGVSTAMHPDTGEATIFVHDGQQGGAGFAEQGYRSADAWIAATLDRLRECECEAGCPRCVVSPKCGNGNQMLDKASAAWLLECLLGGTNVPTER